MDALLAAGERLAEVLRLGLEARGLPSGLHVRLDGERVIVASHAASLREAETGAVGQPPRAPLQDILRTLTHESAGVLRNRMGEAGL